MILVARTAETFRASHLIQRVAQLILSSCLAVVPIIIGILRFTPAVQHMQVQCKPSRIVCNNLTAYQRL